MKLFDISERRPFDIGKVAVPTDITIFNCNWGEGRTYYADFCGLGYKYKPARVLEIGVRYGYSGMAVCTGAHENGVEGIAYHGIDCELLAMYNCQNSNTVAAAKFAEFCPWVNARFFKVNTVKEPLPKAVLKRQFDYILVDGDHSYEGAKGDILKTWPLLAPGGIMVVDDLGMVGILQAVNEFKAELTATGTAYVYQYHHNERQFGIFQKGT